MIEIIYKNTNTEINESTTLKLPKNIRQIGNGDSDYQIYIEDYLMSYLKKRPEREGDIRYGVLLGEVKVGNGYTYFFINGAVDVEEVLENTIIFNDDIWTGLYDDINNYFVGNRIVGWFASLNDNSNNDMMNIKKLHLDNFAGNDKLFLKFDMEEDEESFYVYENTGLTKQPCYHIYFNKSDCMEDYIFGTGKKDKFKKPEAKTSENGKYGILLNNINEKKAKEVNIEEKPEDKVISMDDIVSKFGRGHGLPRIAAFVMIATVVAGISVMQKDGKLNNITNKIGSFASGIISSDDDKDMGKMISVNGIVGTSEETTTINVVEDSKSVALAGTETTENNIIEETTTPMEEETTQVNIQPQNTYVVKEGDTLLSICIAYYNDKSMLDEVVEANGIENPNIVLPGEELIMP